MNAPDILWVGLAGSAGAVARVALDATVRARFSSRLPSGTIVINVTGSFVLGLLSGLVLFHAAPSRLELVAGTGFCGGYTTFSTASFETVRLAQRGELAVSLLNLLGTALAALAAAGAGLAVAAR